MPTPPTGALDKDDKITKFRTDVINYAVGRITRQLSNAPAGQQTDLVSSSSFSVSPASFASGGQSSVPSRGGFITASALADIFVFYAYNCTSIRRCRYEVARTNDGNNQPASVLWNNQITALSARYRYGAAGFRGRIGAGVWANLQPGQVAAESSIDALIGALRGILAGRMAEGQVTVSACHNSCHSSCHSSRGRR